MPPKPIACAGCDTTLVLCKKLKFQIKIYSQTRVYLVPFIQNFLEEIYMPPVAYLGFHFGGGSKFFWKSGVICMAQSAMQRVAKPRVC